MLNGIYKRNFLEELDFKFSRSKGPGGQHVNKTETKVELRFDVLKSELLNKEEKERIIIKLNNRIVKDRYLILSCQDTRSQNRNKQIVTEQFYKLINISLQIPKKRKITNPSRKTIENRIRKKRMISEKKQMRKKPIIE